MGNYGRRVRGVQNTVAIFTVMATFSGFHPHLTAAEPVRVGSYDGGAWLLDVNGDGVFSSGTDRSSSLGWPGATPIVGDWNGDGKTDIGVYSGDGWWYLDYDGNGFWDGGINDKLVALGWPGAIPVTGDWNGNGKTKIGVYANGVWFLDYDGNFQYQYPGADKQAGWGWGGCTAVVGDWNGDGKTKIGVYFDGVWFLDYDGNYAWDGGIVDKQFGFGWTGVTPIVGDWNGNARTKVGVYTQGYWYIDYDGDYAWEYPSVDKLWAVGWAGTTPVIGDWSGDGKAKPGAFTNGYWYLDYNGNGIFDDAFQDRLYFFGSTSGVPVVGRWAPPGPLAIATASPLPNGQVGISYAHTLTAAGGAPPYTWSLASGTLPYGLALSTAGAITGTPTAAATLNFTVRVTDSTSSSATKPFSLTIAPASLPLAITTLWALPQGQVGVSYSQQLAASGGTSPYTWSLVQGSSLPPSMFLSAGGLLTGTPSAAGPYRFTIRVTDFYSNIKEQAFTVSIIPAGPPVGISPSRLEINLGPVPIDRYFDKNKEGDKPLISSDACTQQMSVRDCYQLLIRDGPNNWRSQGVTGVRFFFGMAGGAFSTPYVLNGAQWVYQTTWEYNLGAFLADLKSWGIDSVTPTPVFDIWSGVQYFENIPHTVSCGDFRDDLYFVPWLPYALEKKVDEQTGEVSYQPERTCYNDTYFRGAANPKFWGWDTFIYLMDRVLAKARAATAEQDEEFIRSLDYFQESNMFFTVQARMIYDNTNQRDVLSDLRSRMAAHGFLAGRVAPSANNTLRPEPGHADYDCPSIYGDSALVETLSGLMAAIVGPASAYGIGEPYYTENNYGLFCGGIVGPGPQGEPPMRPVPLSHTLPTFMDMHTAHTYPSPEDTALNARKLYDAINAFAGSHLPADGLVVIGETNPVNNAGCSQFTYEQASAMVLGTTPTTGYRHSDLYTNRSDKVVIRPWHDATFADEKCTPSPNVIAPPFDPNHQ